MAEHQDDVVPIPPNVDHTESSSHDHGVEQHSQPAPVTHHHEPLTSAPVVREEHIQQGLQETPHPHTQEHQSTAQPSQDHHPEVHQIQSQVQPQAQQLDVEQPQLQSQPQVGHHAPEVANHVEHVPHPQDPQDPQVSQLEALPQAQSQFQPQVQPQVQTQVEPQVQPQVESQVQPQVQSQIHQGESSSQASRVGVYITPEADRAVEIAPNGFANKPATTVTEVFKRTATDCTERLALSVKREGRWMTWNWGQYYNDAVQFARALIHLKFQPFQTVSILGFNSPEWFIADIGAIIAGGLAAGIYTTNGPDACAYIIEHSKSAVVVVENEIQLKKILQVKDKLPSVQAIVQWSGVVPSDLPSLVYSWAAFLELGNFVQVAEVDARMAELKPGRACTLIYTSGTTGPPKAVMLSHDNLTYNAAACATALKCDNKDIIVSYLPLSHIAAQLVDIHGIMFIGGQVWFAQPDALKGSLGNTLKEVRPTIFFGVPRVWEKIQEKMIEIGKNNGAVKKKIAAWARGVGLRGGKARQHKQGMPWGWTIARKMVFEKVRAALGLDRARFLATAAAPMSEDTAEFFLSLNIPICDVYGMSELTGPTTITPPERLRAGSIGLPVPGISVRIDNPDDRGNGEICWKGRSSFIGYMYNEKETRETYDAEGWLHTGDIGRLDADGFLYITGRIKELIITAGGENVPPVMIEDDLKIELGSVVSNIMAVGDKRKFLACLITLKTESVPNLAEGQYPFTDNLSREALSVLHAIGSTSTTVQDAKQDQVLKKWISDGINRYNKRAVSNAQQIRTFAILDQDFTIENETLTPTMKLKRRIVLQRYSKEIDEMYAIAEKEFGQ